MLSQEEAAIWAGMDTTGSAPYERSMDALAEFWEQCELRGGRLWEVLAAEAPAGFALCAQRSCSQRDVEVQLWPAQRRRAGYRSNASSPAEVLELGHWKQLQLDFVFAGFEKCGTSSISHNLARHPQIEFVPPAPTDPRINTDGQQAQDGNLFWHVGPRFLPPAALVQAFNDGRCCGGGQRVTGVTDEELNSDGRQGSQASRPGGQGRQQVRGERNPVYIYHRILMKMISMVPGARVLLVACDPISWLHSAYADKMNWYPDDPDAPDPPPLRDFAVADDVASPGGFWYNLSRRRALFSLFAKELARLFGASLTRRVHLVHRDEVDDLRTARDSQREVYDRLATFLGVSPFPSDFEVQRKNVRRRSGDSSGAAASKGGLCEAPEAAYLDELQRYFSEEYARLPVWIKRLGGSVPLSVATNQSYCG